MRRLLVLGALALVLLTLAAACGDNGGDGGPAPTSTPAGTLAPSPPAASPAATPRPGEASDWEGFQQFATKMEAALAAKDIDFFLERATFSDYACTGEEEFIPCEQEGQVLHAIAVAPVLPSEGTLMEAAALRDTIQSFLAAAQPDLSDSYGDGALKLYSIARRGKEGGDQEYWALITMMSTRNQSPQRELMILRFRFQNGRWEYAVVQQGSLVEGFGVEKYFSQAPEDLNWERREQ